MLILDNETIERVLNMEDCLESLEDAYRQVAEGTAIMGARTDVLAPGEQPSTAYSLKTMSSLIPSRSVGCLRLNSDVLAWEGPPEGRRRVKLPVGPGGTWVGLVMLFSMETGEPLVIFPDGVVQRMRVGATSGLAVNYLANEDAGDVAIIGSGWQAGGQAMAVCSVRPVRRVRVYSPNPTRREAFCQEWQLKLGVQFQPVATAQAAVEGAEIVLCATNSMRPVLQAEWVAPGAHVGAIRLTELSQDFYSRAGSTFVHVSAEPSLTVHTANCTFHESSIERGKGQEAFVGGLPTLFDLIGGKAMGRKSCQEITCFLNNIGLGIQFAAVGYEVWKKAHELQIGCKLPTPWFTQTLHS